MNDACIMLTLENQHRAMLRRYLEMRSDNENNWDSIREIIGLGEQSIRKVITLNYNNVFLSWNDSGHY